MASSPNPDILIIGGGVAGLSAAAALADQANIVVLEAEDQPGFHSSGRSAALLHYALGNPPVRRLTQASRSFFEAPQDGCDTPLSSRLPILTPARADELNGLRSLADDLAPFTEIEQLDADGLRGECPVLRIGDGHAVRGFIDRTALKLDGHGLLQVYSHRLNASGRAIYGNARIAGMEWSGSVWRTRSSK